MLKEGGKGFGVCVRQTDLASTHSSPFSSPLHQQYTVQQSIDRMISQGNMTVLIIAHRYERRAWLQSLCRKISVCVCLCSPSAHASSFSLLCLSRHEQKCLIFRFERVSFPSFPPSPPRPFSD